MRTAAVARGEGSREEIACPEYPAAIESLLGALLHQHHHLGDRDVCHRMRRERAGLVAEPIRLAELLERAARGAAVLRRAGVGAGDRVVLSLSDPHDFLVAFFATSGLGATAVPLPTVAESGAPRSFAARVRAVGKDCAPRAAVVEGAARFVETVGELQSALTILEPAQLAAAEIIAIELRDCPASSPAFIQYTSGSTGAPKGVVVTHRNLMANCRAIRDATAYTRADRMVCWLPLHHDMGLVGGLLTSLYCAAETWLMPPMAFVGRPVTWLEAMTRYRATLTVGPTFAYSLCARRIPDKQLAGVDLSSLRLAYIGAEVVDSGTVAAFSARFTPYGLPPTALYPVYGLAEATLAVSFPAPGSPIHVDTVDRARLAAEGVAAPSSAGDTVDFVSVGRPLPRHRVTIVDLETRQPVGERRVGELVAEGESITPRYFGDEDSADRVQLATGDLAYTADGHLFIVDRIKDLVIIAGQNYAPSDIESAAAEVSGVRRGCIVAFSSAGAAGTEELHLVAEAAAEFRGDPAEIGQAIQRRVREHVQLSPASVTIVAPGVLERTSSGKIKRRACAEAHRRGELRPVTRRDLARTRRRRMLAWLRHRLGL